MPWINDYVRSDGTPVKGHSRLPAGARRETALLGLIVAGVIVFGNGTTTAGAGAGSGQELPRPESTVVYPIKWPAWENHQAPLPQPTVSYPIVFPSTGGNR
ncbi:MULTISPECIES: hypothetical protein [Streptomyces]|uniref:hypothetical protein n=1 Tax=Streptomyces TaxID=1883 RepID=UPI000ACC8543|nr:MULTISPECIES: hypothetical protein [unclassified Streptomyces]QNE26223.1 hypothetical protein F1D59_16665 [Streptomyces sp. INR7]